jgi:hypothetical protein
VAALASVMVPATTPLEAACKAPAERETAANYGTKRAAAWAA